jgi:hypothetical protein
MNCTQARHAIHLDLDGELTPLRKRALRRHLAGCNACRATMQQHTAIRGAMARLAEQSRDREGAEPKTIKFPPAPDHSPRWRRFAAVAAVLALCIAGWQVSVSLRRHHSTGTARAVPNLDPPIPPASPRPIASVEFDPSADVIVVPKPTRNPNITVLWIYPAVRTAEAPRQPIIEPESNSQGAHT